MAAYFPNGTVFSISSEFADEITVTGTSNANPAIATVSGTAPETGAIVLISSSWSGVNDRVARIGEEGPAGSVTLEGIDTTDTTFYEPGSGSGILTPVSSWVQLSQVTASSKSGGDQQFYQWQYLEDRTNTQKQRPTYKNSKTLTLTLDYDPALAWYEALDAADMKGQLIVLRAALPTGALLFYPVYPSFDADPSLELNQNMQNTATFSLAGRFTRYEAA